MDGLALRGVTVTGLPGPLSITIRPGEIGALVVPDEGAAGRLADVAAGCAIPVSGRVLVAGQRIGPRLAARGNSVAAPARVGLVPVDGGLLPHLTVADNISYGLRYGDRVRPDMLGDRVREIARQLGVSDVLGARPADLTPGRRLRVGLARALLRRPAAVVIEDRTGAPQWLAQLVDVEPVARVAVLIITDSVQRLAGLDSERLVLAEQHPAEAADLADGTDVADAAGG
jgi:ABC-type thiamine transport system ATPase subunit